MSASEGVVILVMGVTGVGKSTFISKLTGDDSGIGHELTSFTQGMGFHTMQLKGKSVHLVDTPGFNDTWRSDIDILSEIVFILCQIYKRGMKTAGILYLHRISDNRVSGSAMKNFKLLESVCGFESASRVSLVTTMWGDTVIDPQELLRESRLVSTDDFWGRLCRHGSRTKRWRGDGSSALSIVDELVDRSERGGYRSLLIQREIVDEEKPLKETTAGRVLIEEYRAAEVKMSEELVTRERGSQHQIDSSLADLKRDVESMKSAQRELGMSILGLFAEREKAYAKVATTVRREQERLAAELERSRREYRRLEEDLKSNQSLLEAERKEWTRRRARLDEDISTGRRRRTSVEKEYQQIDEEEKLFQEQLVEMQTENNEQMSQTSDSVQKLRKRDVMRKNLLPFLGALAGTGMAVAGGLTGILPLATAGVAFTLSSASQVSFSRKPTAGEPSGENQSLIPDPFTTAGNTATITDAAGDSK
ncbi:hypothetical protein B0T10DRAFT_565399 [Thelonectria olida]|uniref:G domain-containing protein n=1 Tax=Thelonectria olida TaxID=1576542 RepID=A0A9P8VZ13_9HYPO|nr:hypothetical protein B0T10DRAFT_565399 [Thelonectria olida]